MAATTPFKPSGFGNAVSIAATSTSGSGSLTSTSVATNSQDILVVNLSTTIWAYVRWGKASDGTVVAGLNDVPIGPGTTQVFFKGDADTFAAITGGSDAGTIKFYPGLGE